MELLRPWRRLPGTPGRRDPGRRPRSSCRDRGCSRAGARGRSRSRRRARREGLPVALPGQRADRTPARAGGVLECARAPLRLRPAAGALARGPRRPPHRAARAGRGLRLSPRGGPGAHVLARRHPGRTGRRGRRSRPQPRPAAASRRPRGRGNRSRRSSAPGRWDSLGWRKTASRSLPAQQTGIGWLSPSCSAVSSSPA